MNTRSLAILLVGFLLAIAFSSVSAQEELPGPITVENATDLTQLTEIVLTTQLFRVDFVPNGNTLAIKSDAGLQLYDAQTGKPGEQIIEGAFGDYVFSHDGSQLYYSTDDGIQHLDLATLKAETVAVDLSGSIWLSPDDKLLGVDHIEDCYVGGCTGELAIFDLEAGEQVFSVAYESEYVNTLAFSPDGSMLAYAINSTDTWSTFNQRGTAFPSAVVHVVDLDTMEDPLTIDVEYSVMGSMMFTPDSSQLIYSTIVFLEQFPQWSESAVHALNISTGEDDDAWELSMLANTLSPDGQIVFTDTIIAIPGQITYGVATDLIRMDTGEPIAEDLDFSKAAFNPDSTLVAITGGLEADAALRIVDISAGEEIATFTVGELTSLFDIAFSPDGVFLAGSFSEDGEQHVLIWSAPND